MLKLILFDIDGTLVLTGGAGSRAMARAFQDVFGIAGAARELSFSGRTDAWILAELGARHGVQIDGTASSRFYEIYLRCLEEEVQRPGPRKGVMPGVRPLLDVLSARQDVYLGLLTGNVEAAARVKLEYFDLWRYFRCGAFGDTAVQRSSLFAAALMQLQACGGPAVRPEHVVIVGDTPHDIAVARDGGGRSVGVATGSYPADVLRASGADVVLDDLGDLQASLAALLAEKVHAG